MTSVKDQPKALRPRERLQSLGVEQLTTEELLTILLGSGSKAIPVQQLAKKITEKFASEKTVSLSDLLRIKGIGLAKACQIVAALEFVERVSPRFPEMVLDSEQKVLQVLADLRYSDREQLVGLYLNARMRLIHKEVLAMGALNQIMVTPREIFGVIRHHPVAYLILAHNHPSGDVTPSPDDLEFTQRIQEAGQIMGVQLLDHVIVSVEHSYSFRREGQLH